MTPLLKGATRRAEQQSAVMPAQSKSGDASPHSKKWPHAPAHWLFEPGIYMVTAGTYRKQPYLNTPEKRDFFVETLFACAAEFGWRLQAWAIMPNHYHFIAASPDDSASLRRLIGKLHMVAAKQLNDWDGQPGRKVWFQYWDSHITFERSYLARLKYVHHNPAHHGLVGDAVDYHWCLAVWFEQNASPAFVSTVYAFKTDELKISDDF